ncbi:1,2-phenylacetyl-CoA epoxidase subunit PaaE [Ferruginibacter sp. HRS2-29]|uniref:1,2-phenylacetyl-CoA epoxidase subunit PaaE n=1 Tax=Ferruginibacter sp. HRS2-29 TaxID=2487334 RepID=UPI0020CBD4BC|nr:1,2-phenylacetyl-CoA epoxidase subunit PaaE [Ferruginibacter sp. HRS2-29]MCP9753037.1 phenylacetate-CoA oxygenase/reductase subunit PaaK [Ferruginibacter sp. HRS2-29]
MAAHFHPLKIRQIRRETPDCVSVSFEVPENLQEQFLYREGQNITIRKSINGEELRRSYSICTAPHENELKVAIKKVDGGLFSSFANENLEAGDTLEIMPPSGKFNAKSAVTDKGNYLAIAAGSGITPVISIIKHILKSNDDSSFTLIYGNKTRGSIIFFEELEGLKNKFMERFNFINILSRERTDADINYGRIDEEKLSALSHLVPFSSFNDIYICGPEKMIFASENFLKQKGIDKSRIHFELFTTPGQTFSGSKTNTTAADSGPKSKVSIKVDGRSVDFDLGFDTESILDAALKNGADLPFACKGGVCCTCRAKLVEGEVRMDVNYALEPEEVEQGFILTCQSHPVTDKVVIDFDVK